MATFKFLSISYEGSDDQVVQLLGQLADQVVAGRVVAPAPLPAPAAEPAALPPPSKPTKAPRARKADAAEAPAGEAEGKKRRTWSDEQRAKFAATRAAKAAGGADNGRAGLPSEATTSFKPSGRRSQW